MVLNIFENYILLIPHFLQLLSKINKHKLTDLTIQLLKATDINLRLNKNM